MEGFPSRSYENDAVHSTQIDVSYSSREGANDFTDHVAKSLAEKGLRAFQIGFNDVYKVALEYHNGSFCGRHL